MIYMTQEEFFDQAEDYMGFCINCQEWTTGDIPADARNRRCEHCEQTTVHGADIALIRNLVKVTG